MRRLTREEVPLLSQMTIAAMGRFQQAIKKNSFQGLLGGLLKKGLNKQTRRKKGYGLHHHDYDYEPEYYLFSFSPSLSETLEPFPIVILKCLFKRKKRTSDLVLNRPLGKRSL